MILSQISSAARKVIPAKYCGAVIVAAGNASRMGGIDKVMAPLGGEPMVVHSVRAFQESPVIGEIIIVTRPDLLEQIMGLCRGFDKVKAVVAGGADRVGSVKNGLSALSNRVRLAAVHDGARPLVSQAIIDRTVRAAGAFGAAAPAVPVKDTVKLEQGGLVYATPDRSRLRAVQTPQVFDKDILCAAIRKAQQDGVTVTDDCSCAEYMGVPVKLTEGEEKNMKITTPLDLKIAQLLWEEEK